MSADERPATPGRFRPPVDDGPGGHGRLRGVILLGRRGRDSSTHRPLTTGPGEPSAAE
ncbi:hypothetical protein MINT15_23200 [Saccharomonospora viridis]|uniref:Uncharacterized protein n=2 Tax=Saccharomonospora viridis TaxID=1852 RepID=C7MWD5_SACVD|nr:hypothetical protein Svir_07250 [Saccharomonospora viridis DSM 43017]KHF44015.1 hypothetical protein MINT15_23200 [Saccharomonospora viridis]